MATNKFLNNQQEQQVIEAISKAEQRTSAEIRIHLEEECSGGALEEATQVFHELGMDHTEQQNGVLIYVASEDRKAAIFGGKGIHSKVENDYWDQVLKSLLDHFKNDAFVEGLEDAIQQVGQKLSEFFPYQQGDTDELTNEISYENND